MRLVWNTFWGMTRHICLLCMYILYFLYKNLHIWCFSFSPALSNWLQTCPDCLNYLLHNGYRPSRPGRATYMHHQDFYCGISQCVKISLSSLSLHLAVDLLVSNICKLSLGSSSTADMVRGCWSMTIMWAVCCSTMCTCMCIRNVEVVSCLTLGLQWLFCIDNIGKVF